MQLLLKILRQRERERERESTTRRGKTGFLLEFTPMKIGAGMTSVK